MNKEFLIATLFHIIIFLFIFFAIDLSSVHTGSKNYVKSYIYSDQSGQIATSFKKETLSSQPVHHEIEQAKLSQKKVAIPTHFTDEKSRKNPLSQKRYNKALPSSSPNIISLPSQPDDSSQKTLVGLLHNAIQNKQHYPDDAVEMKREGNAKVGFTLYPEGSITGLHLITSSGTQSLDDAALKAVQSATPFQGVSEYIKTSQTFNIEVAFVLDN